MTVNVTPVDASQDAPNDGKGYVVRDALFSGGNEVTLLTGGDQLFPAMHAAIARARHEIWLATYIFHDDAAARAIAEALTAAARRGVHVRVVVDGFGSKASLPTVRRWLDGSGVELAVFRPIDRWVAWLQPERTVQGRDRVRGLSLLPCGERARRALAGVPPVGLEHGTARSRVDSRRHG